MKFRFRKSFKAPIKAKRSRLRRSSGKIFQEIAAAVVLLGAVSAIGSLMIFSYNVVLTSTWFQLDKTVVKGCARTTEKDILLISGIKPSQNILALSTKGIARKIMANPWVEDVSVVRELPNRIVIEIQERKPVALVKKEENLFFVDGQGLLFKKFEGEEANLPVLTGCESGKDEGLLIRKSIELIDFLSASGSFPQIRNVSEIHGDETLGFSIFLDSGLCLRLGFGDYENKIKRLKPVLTDLTRTSMDQGFLLIDLIDPGKITVQKKDVPGTGRGKELRT